MSEGQRQQQQHHSIESNSQNQALETNLTAADPAGHRLPTRRARVGALLGQVYKRPKGGVSPYKVLFKWTKQLVSFCIPRDASGFLYANPSSFCVEPTSQRNLFTSCAFMVVMHMYQLLTRSSRYLLIKATYLHQKRQLSC